MYQYAAAGVRRVQGHPGLFLLPPGGMFLITLRSENTHALVQVYLFVVDEDVDSSRD